MFARNDIELKVSSILQYPMSFRGKPKGLTWESRLYKKRLAHYVPTLPALRVLPSDGGELLNYSATSSDFSSDAAASLTSSFAGSDSSSTFFVPKVNVLPATNASISSWVCAT